MFLKLSFFIFFLSVIRVCFFIFLKVVTKPADRAVFRNILFLGPPVFLYIHYMKIAPFPLIHFDGSTGYMSILLTIWTYVFCKIAILWGGWGYVLILSRFVVYWFGLRGGIWSPLIKWSGYVFQFWVRVFPIVMGGMFDIGPIIGMQIHQRATIF